MAIKSGGETLLVHADKGSFLANGLIIGGEVFVGFHPDALHIFPGNE